MIDLKPHVRVRVAIPAASNSDSAPSRETFWKQVREYHGNAEVHQRDPMQLERMLTIALPRELHQLLVKSMEAPLSGVSKALESSMDRYGWRDLEHWLMMSRHEKMSFSPMDFSVALTQLSELMANQLRDIPGYSSILERMGAAARVTISARIIAYSSLEFGLTFGNLESLAKAFESDFESFKIFLDAFVPQAFESIFLNTMGYDYEWSIRTDPSFENSFNTAAAAKASPETSRATPTAPSTPLAVPPTPAAQRAEWLWRLANGSLLIPVALLLAVLFFTIQEVSKTKSMQADAMKPVLDYYQAAMKLQQEELERAAVKNTPRKQEPNTAVERDAPKAARPSP